MNVIPDDDYLTVDELYRLASDDNHIVRIDKLDGTPDVTLIGHAWGGILSEAENWIETIGNSYSTGITSMFSRVTRDSDARLDWRRNHDWINLASPLGRFVLNIKPLLNSISPVYCYSDRISALLEVCAELGIDANAFDDTCVLPERDVSGLPLLCVPDNKAALFERLVERLHNVTNSAAFKKRMRERAENGRRNQQRGEQYFRALLATYSKLLVVRVDLFYDPSFLQHVPLEKVIADRNRFFDNLAKNSKLSEHMLGYIWKLESGEIRGPHYHFIFFFDGQETRRDVYRSLEIGRYWQEVITKGWGRFYSCNAHTDDYAYRGIGMIGHGDYKEREYFERYVLRYLTKLTQYLKVKASDKTKVFVVGQLPKARDHRRGRPRRSATAVSLPESVAQEASARKPGHDRSDIDGVYAPVTGSVPRHLG